MVIMRKAVKVWRQEVTQEITAQSLFCCVKIAFHYLSLFGLLQQNIKWVACTEQKFISHSSVNWEVDDHVTSRITVW